MTTESLFLAKCGTLSLTRDEVLHWLQRQAQLPSVIVNALTEKLLLTLAKQVGLTISDEELQHAADRFRHQQHLGTASQTLEWLVNNGLSDGAFENRIENELLIRKLKTHVTTGNVEAYFEQYREQFDQLTLRHILVPREDLARELVTQMLEDGEDFAELAKQHSLLDSAPNGGRIANLFRFTLAPAIASALTNIPPGEVIGPLETERGFHLLVIEEILPAQLDKAISHRIEDILFDAWVTEQFKRAPISLTYLESASVAP